MPKHELPELGMRFTARREALCLVACPDPVILSIGFGEQDKSLKPGDTITIPEAFARFKRAIAPRVADLDRWLKVQLLPHQFSALFSMYYQSGVKFLRGENLLTLINAGKADEALALWPEFDTKKTEDGGQVHDLGLKRRRILEQKLWRTGDYGKLSPIPVWYELPSKPPEPPNYSWYFVKPGDFS